MTEPIQHRQIVVAYDFSSSAAMTVDRAIGVALRAPQHIIHFLTVLDPNKGLGLRKNETVDYKYAEEVQQLLKEAVEERLTSLSPGSDIEFFVHVRLGEPVEQILETAKDLGADLILIGSHGRTGIRRLLLGSVSERVVREALCPVMVVREKGYDDVSLTKIVEVPPSEQEQYVKPHRYSYTNDMVIFRPPEWPLY